ncbi:MAG: DEAD/DEAH box helicase [Leptospirales bacterium]
MSSESGQEKKAVKPSDLNGAIGDDWRTSIREILENLPPLTRRLMDRSQTRTRVLSVTVSTTTLRLSVPADNAQAERKALPLILSRQDGRLLGSCPECHPRNEVLLADGCSHLLGAVSSLLFHPENNPILQEKSASPENEEFLPPYRSLPRPSGVFLTSFASDWGFLIRTGVRSALTESLYRDWQNRFRLPGSTSRPEFKFWTDFHTVFRFERIWESSKGRFPIFLPKEEFPWFSFVQNSRIPVFRPSSENMLIPMDQKKDWRYEGSWTGTGGKMIFSGFWKSRQLSLPAFQTVLFEKRGLRLLMTDRELIDLSGSERFPEGLRRFLGQAVPDTRKTIEEWGDLIAEALSLSSVHVHFFWNGSPLRNLFELNEEWEPRLDSKHSSARGIRIFPYLFSHGTKIPLFGPERNLLPDLLLCPEGERTRILRRDRQAELFMRNVVERGLKKASTESWIHLSPEDSTLFWGVSWKELQKGGFQNGETEAEDGILLSGPTSCRVRLSLAEGGMVRAEGLLTVDGKLFSLPSVEADSPDPFISLDETYRTFLDGETLERLDALKGLFQLNSGGTGLISSYAAAMITLHRPDLSIEVEEGLKGILRPFVPAPISLSSLQILKSEFRGELRPYQTEGVAWLESLAENGLPGILADEMGLGKTITVLAFLLLLKKKKTHDARPVLVVVPASLVYNWEREIRMFVPDLSFILYHGSARRSDSRKRTSATLWITTYGTVRNDLEILRKEHFSVIILDEAQTIKNPDSAVSRALCSLKASMRLAMTGTPIENHLLDLWSLFQFLLPGLLGTRRFFEERYVQGKGGTLWSVRRVEWLRALVFPLILRRTKKDVLKELPPKMHIDHWILPEEEERYAYRMLLERGREELYRSIKEGGQGIRMNMLALLMKIRLFCCHPDLVLGEGQSKVPAPAKFLSVMEKMREALEEGHRILLFSQFTRMLDILERQLVLDGIPLLRLDGGTSLVERKRRVELFQSEDPDRPGVFLSSLKAGGVGFTLTNADFVFHYDPWWNPQVENQATDRVHRIGQSRSVFVYRFLTRGTVEEKVMALKQEKLELFDQMMEGQSIETNAWLSKQLENLLEMHIPSETS